MDFLGLILKGVMGIAMVMGILYIAISNPGAVTVMAITFLVGSVLFLVRG
jgi:hypothetical protein